MNSSNCYTKWYPSEGISNALVLNPTLNGAIRREYVLVASYNNMPCRRTIVKVPVEMACPLQLNVVQTPHPGSNCQTWDVTITATGANPANLLWNNCRKGTDQFSFPPGLSTSAVVYVSAWDVSTGCSVEKWINVGGVCNNGPFIPLSRYALFALLGGGVIFLLYQILKKR